MTGRRHRDSKARRRKLIDTPLLQKKIGPRLTQRSLYGCSSVIKRKPKSVKGLCPSCEGRCKTVRRVCIPIYEGGRLTDQVAHRKYYVCNSCGEQFHRFIAALSKNGG